MKFFTKQGLVAGFFMLHAVAHCQPYSRYQQAPYTTGQAVFVQQPYGSSVYTEYRYDPNQQMSNRLPSYTTNQSVFVQQPYGASNQTRVIRYPTVGRDSQPTTASRYATPADFPSTIVTPYPFGTVRSYTSSPYSTTVQYQTDNPSRPSPSYTSTETYPYTSIRQVAPAPSSIQQPYNSAYNANMIYPRSEIVPYPSTTFQTPYPLSTAPEGTTIQSNVTTPTYPATTNSGYYYYTDPNPTIQRR